jgi:hypothetical protein
MDSFRKISLNSRIWTAALAAAALCIGTWSIAPAPANAGGVYGGGGGVIGAACKRFSSCWFNCLAMLPPDRPA